MHDVKWEFCSCRTSIGVVLSGEVVQRETMDFNINLHSTEEIIDTYFYLPSFRNFNMIIPL